MPKKNRPSPLPILVILLLGLTGISCGVSGIPFLATETPTPTATFTPSPTPTPTSTPTLTPTATPLPTGILIEPQADGSTLFSDFDNKYQLILAEEWIPIPFDQGELGTLVDQLSQDNPKFKDAAEAFKDLDPDVFRLVALNQNPDYLENGGAPNISITALADKVLASMPLSFVTGALEESFAQRGTKVVSTGVNTIANSNGVEVEFLDIEQDASGIKVFQRLVVFQTEDKLILITVTTSENFKAEVFASADEIGASIKLLK